MSSLDVRDLLGLHPSAEQLSIYLASLILLVPAADAGVLQLKSYPDSVYFNYFSLGLSLLFRPQNGYKPKGGLNDRELENENLVLDSIDIYNTFKKLSSEVATKRSAELVFSSHPVSPIQLSLSSVEGNTRPTQLSITCTTTAKEFVQCLGEPDRKGGGAGPSSGSIGIWCEWSKDGIMVEFGGDKARGPQAWERGRDAVWKIITFFPSKGP